MTVIEFYLNPWAHVFASKTIEIQTDILLFVPNKQTEGQKEREER
jgi:hypothetical protein